jgi:hypothetical protein
MRALTALRRHAGVAALVVSLVALTMSMTGLADAARKELGGVRPGALLRLDSKAKVPVKALPTVPKAKAATRATSLGGQSADELTGSCAPTTVDLGTWCLSAALYPLDATQVGKNDYYFATQACVDQGGWLPSAGELIGAADEVKLAGTIGDNQLTASIDVDPSDGLSDRREMTSTLITTAAGASAAGSEGVSDGARGNPKAGEPDPTPLPANPSPETLQYVTVYDNGNHGGFAGSQPVVQPQSFRCAFSKQEGAAQQAEG